MSTSCTSKALKSVTGKHEPIDVIQLVCHFIPTVTPGHRLQYLFIVYAGLCFTFFNGAAFKYLVVSNL